MAAPMTWLVPVVILLSAPAYDVPEGAVVEHLFDGPGDSVVVSYFEPLPESVFCGVGLAEDRQELRRAAAFDSEGRLLWRAPLPTLRGVQAAHVLADTSLVIWGWFRGRSGLPADTLVVRLSGAGTQPLLTRSDIGSAALTAVEAGNDGTIVVTGTFTSIRGQPRSGVARLRPDGALDD